MLITYSNLIVNIANYRKQFMMLIIIICFSKIYDKFKFKLHTIWEINKKKNLIEIINNNSKFE